MLKLDAIGKKKEKKCQHHEWLSLDPLTLSAYRNKAGCEGSLGREGPMYYVPITG